MIIALLLLLDVGLMCYLAWKVTRASGPEAPQDLGLLAFLEERPQDRPAGAASEKRDA